MTRQTMNAGIAQRKIDAHCKQYRDLIQDEHWTLEHAHDVLKNADRDGLNLFHIAALAKAIACFQCEG